MATLDATMPTLLDFRASLDPDDKVARLITMFVATNEILKDMVVREGNLATGHRSITLTGIPRGTWRRLYQGVAAAKATFVPVTDTCGMLEAYNQVDKALADLNGNTSAFRLQQSRARIEGLNLDMAETLIAGNTESDPEKFMGLAPRFDTISADSTLSGYNIVDGGGTGSDNTSIYIVKWGDGCHGIYPKGSKAGLDHQDLGEVTVTESDGSMWQAYRDHFRWDLGLAVPDWRAVSRIANVDYSDMRAGSVNIDDLLIDGYFKTKRVSGRGAIYCNEWVMSSLAKLAKNKSNVNLTIKEFGGEEIPAFWGMPIRQVDAIGIAEGRVT